MEIEDRTTFTLTLNGQTGSLVLEGIKRLLKEPVILGCQITPEAYKLGMDLKNEISEKVQALPRDKSRMDEVKKFFEDAGIPVGDLFDDEEEEDGPVS